MDGVTVAGFQMIRSRSDSTIATPPSARRYTVSFNPAAEAVEVPTKVVGRNAKATFVDLSITPRGQQTQKFLDCYGNYCHSSSPNRQ